MTLAPMRIWFGRLTACTAAFALCRHGMRAAVYSSPEITPAARLLLGAVARLSRGQVCWEICRPQMAGIDQSGRPKAYRLEQLLWHLSRDFAVSANRAPQGLDQDGFHRLLGSYFIAKNRDSVATVCAIEAENQTLGAGPAVCYIAFPAMGRFTARRLNGHVQAGFRVQALPSLRAMAECLRVVPGSPRQVLHWLMGKRAAAAIQPEGIAAGVVLEEGYGWSLRHYPEAGHMYWVESSGLAPSQVVLYCDRLDTPADAALTQAAGAHGWGWIDGANPLLSLERPLAAIGAALAAARPVAPRRASLTQWMHWVLAVTALIQVAAYRQILRRYNVAAIHHFTEFAPGTIALCLAARLENTITVWNLWSVIPYLLARYNWAIADLILAWGPNDRDFHRASGFDYSAIAEVGIVASDGAVKADKDEARTLRARLDPSVNFVLVAFDTSCGPLIPNSGEQVATYLNAVIDLVERHSHWGLMLKPKNWVGDAALLLIEERLRRLAETGRCLQLGTDTKVAVAALAGDVVTGYPVNTAAIVGALRGRPLVQLDLSGMTNPLTESGLAAGLVHTSTEAFQDAITQIAAGRHDVGQVTPWRAALDPWADGEGRHRAAGIIGDFVRLRADHAAPEALRQALTGYAHREGDHHVHWRNDDRTPWHAVRDQTMA